MTEYGERRNSGSTGELTFAAEEAAGCRVIFLDRDGTINEEVHYLYRAEDLRLIPGSAEAIRRFREAGYHVIVVTNQAGVGRGYYTEEEVDQLHAYLNQVLGEEGAHIDAFYFCPHHPEHGVGAYRVRCRCRKPGVGMFEQAEEALFQETGVRIDKAHSFMIGDKRSDLEAGHNFGVRSILVGTGYGAGIRAEQEAAGGLDPEGRCIDGSYEYYAPDLLVAARLVCGEAHSSR